MYFLRDDPNKVSMQTSKSFKRVLIANRGAIAVRIIRTLKKLNIESVAIYHEADEHSLHVRQADIAINLGNGSVADTYLNISKILDIAKEHQVDAIHPGYGFLSENTEFVAACEKTGIAFIGPTAEQIKAFGLKHEARLLAERNGVPMIPGSPLLQSLDQAVESARAVGYPIMLKSTAGGGGIGMQVCETEQALKEAWLSVKRLSANYFSNDGLFLEKFIANARHIEVQIFGDGAGGVVHLGERDCSAQRRNQKVIEETPAPNLDQPTRERMWQTAIDLTSAVNYRNACTVEFIFDNDTQDFYFLEVNTRLQVEHGVTEEVWQVDLVEWMVRLAEGSIEPLAALAENLKPSGNAMQARLYAEAPHHQFLPSAGLLSEVEWPSDRVTKDSDTHEKIRIDTWVEAGIEVPALFDPMIAKIICKDASREQALALLINTLEQSSLYGIDTNLQYLLTIAQSPACQNGKLLTHSLKSLPFHFNGISVLAGGTQTTVQDYPGREGYWHVGIPPSGPMDNIALRQANYLVGNDIAQAGLEITLNGPKLQFHCDAIIAITGAPIEATLDGKPIELAKAHKVKASEILKIGKTIGGGARSYLAVKGGIQCPEYLGSKSTFTLGQFGGHNGRALLAGDTLSITALAEFEINQQLIAKPRSIITPEISDEVELRVVYGPHGAPDFFTENDIAEFFAATWEVHYNSSRTGIRLIGPKPEWARQTGGEAGLHPSNIHDNAYAVGAVDFTGDMPVILGPDGPSLGGFVCPVTVISADLWKLGQLKAGVKVRFIPVTIATACKIKQAQENELDKGLYQNAAYTRLAVDELTLPVLASYQFHGEDLVVRPQGDSYVLLELGPLELSIERRFKIHALMSWLLEQNLPGVKELTPGIRSLQIHYSPEVYSIQQVLETIQLACQSLTGDLPQTIASRIVRIPLSWNDSACQQAIEKYTQSVRPGAPWCPSNIEFIRRINGLADIQAVKDIVFNASYLVMGLGDVYLGAPVATPIDPRHRLVTTKYNPARTWTAENSVGIGGAYLCVYGMEGPGGYQFIGRTLQMWNRYRKTKEFEVPWLLRFFDQIQFYEVSDSELLEIRKQFPVGAYPIEITETDFDLTAYQQFLDSQQVEIAEFTAKREAAFEQELNHWRETGQLTYIPPEATGENTDEAPLPENYESIESPASGNVWKLCVAEGDSVDEGQLVAILESMKMEIEVHASCAGTIAALKKQEGQSVQGGHSLVWINRG